LLGKGGNKKGKPERGERKVGRKKGKMGGKERKGTEEMKRV
jgi:hypothetical protein